MSSTGIDTVAVSYCTLPRGLALDLGYETPAAFATMFERILGVAPSRYHA